MLFAALAAGATVRAAPLLCEPEEAVPFALSRIEEDGTLLTQSGEKLRLAGLMWPDRLEPQSRALLKARLEAATRGETLLFKPALPPDRWGIRPVHVFLSEAGDLRRPFWLQAGIVETGLAPAWPDLSGLCWTMLVGHERMARRGQRGFWAPRAQAARHRILTQNPGAHVGRRMVARWKVHSTRKSQILTYINITPLFRVGASIGLTGKQVETLARQGVAVDQLAGRRIVVRFVSGPTGLLRARPAPGDALMLDDD